MINAHKLATLLERDLEICSKARKNLRADDAAGLKRNDEEQAELTTHLHWVKRVGFNQAALQRIVESLNQNRFTTGYQRWRQYSR